MPYYSWRGVNVFGDIKKGKAFARSNKDLDTVLFGRNIALLSSSNIKIRPFFNRISPEDKIHFFKQLAVLLDSGVRLPDALAILCDQVKNIQLKQVIFAVESDVLQGICLSEALAKQSHIFSKVEMQIVEVGQESGNVSKCLHQLSDHMVQKRAFYKKLKTASILPLITLAFFFLVTFALFAFVVPRFADVFSSLGKDLPPLTQFILKISAFLRSNMFLFAVGFIILFTFLIKKYVKIKALKKVSEQMCMNAPMFGQMYRQSFLVNFLRSVSMLLKGGMRLVPAIAIAKSSIKNNYIKNKVCKIEQDVCAGSTLSQSMTDYGGNIFPQDLVAIVKVGEETAHLDIMLDKAADIYQEKVNRSIMFFSTIFQPLLMIILGLLITLLIFAIYVPIFSLSAVV